MKKAVAVTLAALAALGAVLTRSRPAGPATASAADYPLEAGLRWTYRGAAGLAVVREIGRTVEIGGRQYHELKFVLPVLGTRTIPMRHAEGGVVTVQEGREFPLLRFPMAKGEAWTIDLPSEKEIADCTVLEEEEVEFAGRKGRAWKLEVRRRRRDGAPVATDYEWYAPGFGLVRMEVTLGVRTTFVLESFSPMEAAR